MPQLSSRHRKTELIPITCREDLLGIEAMAPESPLPGDTIVSAIAAEKAAAPAEVFVLDAL